MSDLKPCSCCGGSNNLFSLHDRFVKCATLDIFPTLAVCPHSCHWFTIAEWQNRPIEDALRRDIVELRKALSNARTHMEATGFAEMSVVWTILVDAIDRTAHYDKEAE